jgi:replicative DNA helicase
MLDQQMPRSIEAERAVLGAILLAPNTYAEVDAVLRPDDFSKDEHRLIYRAMQKLVDDGVIIDIFPLKEELKKQGQLDNIGGLLYLSELTDPTPNIAGITTYVDSVKDASLNRRLIRELAEAAKFITKIKPHELVPQLAERLYDIVSEVSTEATPKPIADVVDKVYAEILERHETRNFLTGIPSGLPNLDAYTLGWQRGVMTVFGGYTSAGKTAFGLDVTKKTLTAPGNEGLHAQYIALEMTNQLLTYRLLANASEEKLYQVRTGLVSNLNKIDKGYQELKGLGRRLSMSDSAFDIRTIASIARAAKQQGKLDILFVDYLQLVDDEEENSSNREFVVNQIGKGLLRLAKQLDIALVAFAQLNDGVVNREGHEPKIQDMRESRSINQHARTVIILNRPWMYDRSNTELTPCNAELHILKNSEGRTGMVPLHFNAAYMQFEDGPCHQDCEYWREPAVQEVKNW